jgi:hypothetical protein
MPHARVASRARVLLGASPIIWQRSSQRYWPLGPMCLGDKRSLGEGGSVASPVGRGSIIGHVVRPIPYAIEFNTREITATRETALS